MMPRILAAFLALGLAAGGALAQYPTKTVNMMVPYAAGGPTDHGHAVVSATGSSASLHEKRRSTNQVSTVRATSRAMVGRFSEGVIVHSPVDTN